MEKSTFISFSSKDQQIAASVCEALEKRGIGCWISSRDVKPGENFQAAIVQAIRAAKAMILVFSENANNSDEIKKEIALAGQNHLVVIPVRVEDVKPNDALAYEFSTRQWVDLFQNWEEAMHRLLDQLQTIAGVDPITHDAAAAAVTMPADFHPPKHHAPIERPSLSLVVLPFSNLSGGARHDFLVDAVTEQLTSELARIDDSFVVARNAALSYRGDALEVSEIGRELGVRFAITGNVRAAAGGLRVNTQLIDAENDQPLWVDRFHIAIGDPFSMQHEAVAHLIPPLQAQLLAASGRAPQPAPAPMAQSPAASGGRGETLIHPDGGTVVYPRGTAAPQAVRAAAEARTAAHERAAARRPRQGQPFHIPFWLNLAVIALAGGVAMTLLGAQRQSIVQIVSWMLIAAGAVQLVGALGARSD